MKFIRKDYPTIQDGLVIRFKDPNERFEINASRNGIGIQGSVIAAELDVYLEILQVTKIAWMHHRSIKETGNPASDTPSLDYIDESDIKPTFGEYNV